MSITLINMQKRGFYAVNVLFRIMCRYSCPPDSRTNYKKSDTVSLSNTRLFKYAICTIIVVMISEIITVFLEGAPAIYFIPHVIGNALGFALSPLIPIQLGCAIGGCRNKKLLLFAAPVFLNMLLSILSPFFPIIFRVTDTNEYMRGSAFIIYVIAYIAALICLLLQSLNVARKYQNDNRSILGMLFGFVVFGTITQVISPEIHTSWLCISFALVLYFMYYCDLQHQIDALTGLLNRSSYNKYLSRIKESDQVCVIIFDVDNFKNINDCYGHPFGDYCLTSIAACIRKVFFKAGHCFRIGGDEFCVISNKLRKGSLEKAYRRFLREIEILRSKDSRIPVVSIGYAFSEKPLNDISSIVFEADQNMYHFKRQRKEKQKMIS